MLNKSILAVSLCALCAGAVIRGVRAVPVAANGSASTGGTTLAARPELATTNVTTRIRPFSYRSAGVVMRGTVQDEVSRENTSGKLEFYTHLTVDPGSTGRITMLRRSGFQPAGSAVDADWRIDGLGGVSPAGAERTPDGRYVSFNFPGGIGAGQSSRFIFIRTDARRHRGEGAIILRWQSGSEHGTVDLHGFQPDR